MPGDRKPVVLVVDDQRAMADMLADGLQDRGFDASAVTSGTEALARLERDAVDALVTDLRMSPVDGLALLAASRRQDPDRPVILMTAFSAIDSAVEAIRQGAYHYLAKPFKLDELVIYLHRALDEAGVRREAIALRRALRARTAPPGMVGNSAAMGAVFEIVARVADTTAPVLITGETGTGKGVVAAALHAASRRAAAPLVTVNCAALPEALLETELFGHVKGAFTGATATRLGLVAEADGGTLLLDEIGEMAPALQAKLLHVLERGAVRPVGGQRELPVDVRIVTATHRDLRTMVQDGTFREDLLYRLEVVAIEMPPLRRRTEDIPDLVAHFLRAARERYPNAGVAAIGREALARLMDYRWPGNVRELAHVVERMVLLGRGPEAGLEDLPPAVTSEVGRARMLFTGEVVPMREMQRRYAAWALDQSGGVRSRTAEHLDIDIKTLGKLLTEGEPSGAGKPPGR